jgi:glycosyltransferase involved in cell wall biosynthesis
MPTRSRQPIESTPSVLILAYYYPPSPAVGGVRPYHFAKYLQRYGYSVTVITGSEQGDNKPENVIYVPPPERTKRTVRGLSELVLRKFFFPYDDAMLWAAGAYQAAAPILADRPGSFVFSTFPPINTHIAALALKRRYPIHWIADFRDPLANCPGRLVSNQRRTFTQGSIWADNTIESLTFRYADKLIANSDVVAAMWKKSHPEWAHKVEHIWNGFDPEERLTAAAIPVKNSKVMVHVGGIFQARHPGLLLASLDRLIGNGWLAPDSFRLRLIGFIEDGSITDKATFDRLLQLGVVEVTGTVPKAQALRELRSADYLLLLDVNDFDAGQQLPSKIFEYIQIGRPVIALTPRNSPAERILNNSGIRNLCLHKDSTPEEVDRGFMDFLNWPADPVQPTEWFLREFDAAARVRKLASLMDTCLTGVAVAG